MATIRQATEADIPAVARFARQYGNGFGAYGELLIPDNRLLVLDRDEGIGACLGAERADYRSLLRSLPPEDHNPRDFFTGNGSTAWFVAGYGIAPETGESEFGSLVRCLLGQAMERPTVSYVVAAVGLRDPNLRHNLEIWTGNGFELNPRPALNWKRRSYDSNPEGALVLTRETPPRSSGL